MKNRLLLALLLISSSFSLQAQDIHFSQIDADPMLLNPAYAGFFNGAGRFGVIYRNQWASVSAPFQTFALTGEGALWRSDNHRKGLSIGGTLFNDHAGTLAYGTTSLHLSLAYYTAINQHGNNYLSFGIDGGYALSGFDPTLAEFEDPSESFATQQTTYPLFCLGMAWYCQPNGDLHTKVGFSVRNLNRPNISYLGLDNTYLERRYSLFSRAEYRHWNNFSLMPILMYQMQGQHQELLYGADFKWYLQEGGAHEVSLRAGIAVRHADAIIANLMIEYDNFVFTFCYDANISGLASATNTIGAFEGGLVYRLASSSKKTRAIKCPQY